MNPSFFLFSWMTSLFVKGSKATLEQENLEGVMPEDCIHPLTEALERCVCVCFQTLYSVCG